MSWLGEHRLHRRSLSQTGESCFTTTGHGPTPLVHPCSPTLPMTGRPGTQRSQMDMIRHSTSIPRQDQGSRSI